MAAYSFTERGPLETGFAEIFQIRIVPVLERHEAERVSLKTKAVRAMSIAGVGGLGGAGAGFSTEYEVAGTAAGVFGGMGVFGARAFYEHGWKAGLGSEIVPILCAFLGEMRPGGAGAISVTEFERLGVVPSYNNARTEDPVSGTHMGIDWALTEAVLTKRTRDSKGRTRSRTVFRGLLFQIAVDRPAPRIYFARDRGGMINWLSESLSDTRRGLERLEVPDPEFERLYEVYTDDVVAAQDYIGPGLIDGLKLVAEHEARGGYVACAFEGDWFRIALPRRDNFLSLGSLFKPTHDIEDDLHRALWDLDLPRRVIDALAAH